MIASIQPYKGMSNTVRDIVAKSIMTSYLSFTQSSPIILNPYGASSLNGNSTTANLSIFEPGILI